MMERAFAEVAGALRNGRARRRSFPRAASRTPVRSTRSVPASSGSSKRTPVPVVPLALRGLWGSFFSRKGGAAMTKPFRRAPFAKIGLAAARPIPPGRATPAALQAEVQALRGDWR